MRKTKRKELNLLLLKVGDKIRELRQARGVTQENLADALGITAQAVSRWESGTVYPDMELIPGIANYFGVTIDELFGCQSQRDDMIEEIIAHADEFEYRLRSDDEWVDNCILILRDGLQQFPENERLLMKLADVLYEAGWKRHNEWKYYDDEGYIRHDYDRERKNPYWSECINICEKLADNSKDTENMYAAVSILIILCRNMGDTDNAVAYASRMPYMNRCRELALCSACDGKQEAKYIGEALLSMAGHFATQTVYAIVNNKHNIKTDMPIEKIKGVIAIFDLLCEDKNYGEFNGNLIELYLFLSRVQWERGYHDDAFGSLDKALECAKVYESLCDGKERSYTSMLLKHVTFCEDEMPIHISPENLPEQWPVWTNPDCSEVEAEIKADPRWAEWVEKCNG